MKRSALLVAVLLAAGCQAGSDPTPSGSLQAPTAVPDQMAPPKASPIDAPSGITPHPVAQPVERPAPNLKTADENYVEDVSRLCNVIALSGAAGVPEGERMVPMAQWLAANIVTDKAKDFIISTNQIGDMAQHAAALDAEAQRVGLEGCPLSAEWRK